MVSFVYTTIGILIFSIVMLWFHRLNRSSSQRLLGGSRRPQGVIALSGWMVLHMVALLLTGPLAIINLILLALHRMGERRAFLATLAVCVDKQIPLSVAARSFAQDRRDDFGSRVTAFADAIDTGASTEEALKKARIGLPTAASLAISSSVGSEQDFGHSLMQAAKHGGNRELQLAELIDHILHLLITSAILLYVVTFLMVFVVPTYIAIWEDFDVGLPLITEFVIGFSNSVAQWVWLFVPLSVVLLLYLLYQFIRYLGWPLPKLHDLPGPIGRIVHSPLVLESMHRTLSSKLPFQQHLDAVAQKFPDRNVGKRLKRVANDVEQGGCWIRSLRNARLISAIEQDFLLTSQKVGNIDWAVLDLAARKRDRLAHRLSIVLEWASPLSTLALAIPIGIFATAMFLPLVQLIERLSF